jgi:tetratricopeptide (TPR) repeat protein
MDLAQMAREIVAGDTSGLARFKELLIAENDVSMLKRIAASHWQEDQVSIPVFVRILEITPNDDEALADLGLIKYLIGEDAEASECLEKAQRINPEGLQVLTLQAALEKRADERIKIYNKMLQVDPNNKVALHNLARSQGKQSDKLWLIR